jgi:hypothetical protein
MNPPDRHDDASSAGPAEEAFTAAAHLLASQPGAVRRALATHRRAPNGCCAACGATTRWPCAIAAIAHRAADFARPDIPNSRG